MSMLTTSHTVPVSWRTHYFMPRSPHDMPDSSDLMQDSVDISPVPSISRNVLRHTRFTLFVGALVAATLLVFSQTAFSIQNSQNSRASIATPQPTATRVAIQANVRVFPAQMHIYPTADPRASLMQPVVDREGNVWFGE